VNSFLDYIILVILIIGLLITFGAGLGLSLLTLGKALIAWIA
jgi:hypothetical protein